MFSRKVFHRNQTKWSQVHNNSNCRRGWRISVWLWPKECYLVETSLFVPAVEVFNSKEKVVVERKKPPSFVVADNLNQPSDEVPLHVENPLSDKIDVILPSNEVNDSPASNEIDENALSNIVAAKQSLNEFYENVPSNIVADNQSRNEFDRKILWNVVIGNQATNVVEKLASKEIDEKQSINEGAVEKNTDLEDSLQVE